MILSIFEPTKKAVYEICVIVFCFVFLGFWKANPSLG